MLASKWLTLSLLTLVRSKRQSQLDILTRTAYLRRCG